MLPKTPSIQSRLLKIFFTAGIVIASMAALVGCTQKYGRIERSNKITEIFETKKILPDHRYYYHGFGAMPYVIVGIQNDYMLRSSAWNKINLTPTLLNTLIFRMQAAYSPLPQGAWILGPEGERLGIWYSSERWTAVRLTQDNRIVLSAPQPAELRGIP